MRKGFALVTLILFSFPFLSQGAQWNECTTPGASTVSTSPTYYCCILSGGSKEWRTFCEGVEVTANHHPPSVGSSNMVTFTAEGTSQFGMTQVSILVDRNGDENFNDIRNDQPCSSTYACTAQITGGPFAVGQRVCYYAVGRDNAGSIVFDPPGPAPYKCFTPGTNPAPAITFSATPSRTWYKSGFSVDITYSDSSTKAGEQLQQCSYRIRNGESWRSPVSVSCSGTSRTVSVPISVPDGISGCSVDGSGACVVEATARDNINTETAPIFFNIDIANPSVSNVRSSAYCSTPGDNRVESGKQTFITASVSDSASGISECSMSVTGPGFSEPGLPMAVSGSVASRGYTFFGTGSYQIVVSCQDNVENSGSAALTLNVVSAGSCTPTVAICPNSMVENGEVCDSSNLNGWSCTSFGYTGGTLKCHSDCKGFDTSSCITAPPPASCGNGIIESENREVCDGSNLNGLSCASFGYTGGTLRCSSTCTSYDFSGCTTSTTTTIPGGTTTTIPGGTTTTIPGGTTTTTTVAPNTITVTGNVWNDVDQDGVKDLGEANIPGLGIRLVVAPCITGTSSILGGTTNSAEPQNYFLNVPQPAGCAPSSSKLHSVELTLPAGYSYTGGLSAGQCEVIPAAGKTDSVYCQWWTSSLMQFRNIGVKQAGITPPITSTTIPSTTATTLPGVIIEGDIIIGEVKYDYVQKKFVSLLGDNSPDFTKGMISDFFVGAIISSIPARDCTPKNGCHGQAVFLGSGQDLVWSPFDKAWKGALDTLGASCDTTQGLKIIMYTDAGASAERTFNVHVNCNKKVIVSPFQARVAVGTKNDKIFDVTVYDPQKIGLSSDKYNVHFNTDRLSSNNEYLSHWIKLGCPTCAISDKNRKELLESISELAGSSSISSDGLAVTGITASDSSRGIYRAPVFLSDKGAQVAGTYGVTFTAFASPEIDGSAFLSVFAEGLNEFAAWQAFAALVAAILFLRKR